MKIKAITIENFKSISEPVRIEFKPLTLLFGPNSAGKSTIIQALHYIREVLEFRRLDVDKTISGGDFIDLGGFDNFVHGHDLSKKVSFEIELHDVDSRNYFHNYPDNVEEKIFRPLLDEIKENECSRIKFSIGKTDKGVYVDSCLFNYKGVIVSEKLWNGDTTDSIWYAGKENLFKYELLRSFLFSEEINSIEFCHEIESIINDHSYVKNKIDIKINELNNRGLDEGLRKAFTGIENDRTNIINQLDKYSIEELRDHLIDWDMYVSSNSVSNMIPKYGDEAEEYQSWWDHAMGETHPTIVRNFAEQSIIGTIVDELRTLLYVGPLRVIPPRNYSPQKTFAPSRWSDGLAAWDVASYSNQKTIDEINKWLGKKHPDTNLEIGLDTGYALKRKAAVTLEQDDLQLMENPDTLSKEDLVSLVARLRAGKVPKVALTQGKNGLEVSLCDVGVGISQTFPVVMAALDKDAKIVIIEQPELHIHPRLQVSLGDLFISAAKQDKCMIIETHSEHLLLRLLRRIRETSEGELPLGILGLAPTELSVNYLEKVEDCPCVRQLQVSADGDSLGEWPKGFFEERAGELF